MVVSRVALATRRGTGRRPAERRGRALPAHLHHAAALERRDGAARARVLAPGDGVEPASARRPATSPTWARSSTRSGACPTRSPGADLVIMGQEAEVFARNGIQIDEWEEADAPARRRRWHDSGQGMHAVLLASASDVDDLIPTLVAFQIEWNKLRVRQRAAGWPPERPPTPEECAQALGGSPDDWARLREAWGERFDERLSLIAERRMNLRVRMLGGTQVGYARMTRRWWTPVHGRLAEQGLTDRPMYLVSSNTHSLVNIATGVAREREDVAGRVRRDAAGGATSCARSWRRSARGAARGRGRTSSTSSRGCTSTRTARRAARRGGARSRRAACRTCRSKTALRVPAQIIPLAKLHPERLDSRLGEVDAEALGRERRGGGEHRLPARAWRPTTSCARWRWTARRCAASTCSARRRR